jgi:nucleoid-associated protein YgaU
MSAVLMERPDGRTGASVRLTVLPAPRRPDATARRDRALYRRRRLLAAGLLLLLVAAASVLAQLIQAGIGGGPLTTTDAAAAPVAIVRAGATQYVVRPGDTLWSIAARLQPGRDERPLVDEMARQVGGAFLYPGEVIAVPVGR